MSQKMNSIFFVFLKKLKNLKFIQRKKYKNNTIYKIMNALQLFLIFTFPDTSNLFVGVKYISVDINIFCTEFVKKFRKHSSCDFVN